MSPDAPDPTLSRQFAALVGYHLVLTCSHASSSAEPCDGEVVMRSVTSCCGRTTFSCAGHHDRAVMRQAAGQDVDPVCGRRNNAPAWYPV